MSDINLRPLNKSAITPEVVLEYVKADIEHIREIYVVAFSKDGQIMEYISGEVKGMAFAAAVLQEHALQAAAHAGVK